MESSVCRIGDKNKSLQTLELNVYGIMKESHAVKHSKKKKSVEITAFYRLEKFYNTP